LDSVDFDTSKESNPSKKSKLTRNNVFTIHKV
jgi:hypothetical protein